MFAAEDCAVAENMMLAADSLDVGSCYIGAGWTAFADPYGQEIAQLENLQITMLSCSSFSDIPEKRQPSDSEGA